MLLAALAALACEGGSSTATIDRDVFIAAYVDLRTIAIDSDSARLADDQRAEVLARHGVTEADLVTFADAHAAELEFMRDVWTEVETRLDRQVGEATGDEPTGS